MTIRRATYGWIGIMISLLLQGLCASFTWAADVSWINGSGGNWSTAGNWDTGTVPGPSDDARITLDGTYTVTLDVSASVASLALGAPSGTQSLSAANRTLTLGNASSVHVNGLLSMTSSTLNGPGLLTNAGTVALTACTVNASLSNEGLLRAMQTTSLNGALSTSAGSTLRVEGATFTASLTVASGFTNNGTIEMIVTSGVSAASNLTVTSGTLVNAPGGGINVLAGTGGTRTFTAQLDNQGTFFVGTALTMNKASADHVNSGTLDVSGGDLVLAQSATSPSFTNSGALTIGSGRTMSVSGGSLIYDGGALSGGGALSLANVTMTLNADLSNAAAVLTMGTCTVNGPATLTNVVGQTLSITACTINAPFSNGGLLRALQTSSLNGAVSTTAGSTLRVEGTAFTANLTVASGFTNNGTIEMIVTSGGAAGSTLNVTSGTLVNAPGAAINVLAGMGGTRTFTAQLDNQGTFFVGTALTMNKASADHVNSGTLDVSGGNLTLTQSGTTPTFTNSGALTIGNSRTMSVSGGSLIYDGGALSGGGTLSLANVTMTLNADLSNASAVLTMGTCTVNGPSTLTNAADQTLSITACTINAPFSNEGLLRALQTSSLNGAVSTTAGSTLRVEGTAFTASLTVASGFTNNGTIELIVTTGGAAGSTLNVTSGTLVNAAGAALNVLAGAGGSRVLTAQLDNQGTFLVGTALTINKGSADHANSGTLDVSGGDLTLTQSATSPSFTNSGALTIGIGRTMSVTGGSLIYNGGALSGGGALSLANLTMTLNAAFSTAAAGLTMSTCTVNGPATLTNAANQTLSMTSCTINAPLSNEGLLRAMQTTNLNAALSTLAGSTLRAEGVTFTANLTVASGFTNNGTIEMIATSGGAIACNLTVTSGALVNAAGGAINVLAGTGGTRTLTAQLDNQGTFLVGTALTMNKASADHVNSGTIDVSGGSLTVTQSGTTPSFMNSGMLEIESGRTVTVTGGTTLNATSATLRGEGTLVVSASAFTNAGIIEPGASPGVLTVTGNAPMTATSLLKFDLGGYTPGTGFDRLAVSGTVSLAGAIDVALVNGFAPSLGDSFVVLIAGSLSGGFSCVRGTEIGGGLAIMPIVGAATLTLTVVNSTSTNSPPNAVDDGTATAFDMPLVIPIVANDSDADGDSIILRSLDLAGTVGSAVVNADGQSITYTPLFLFLGQDTLRYTIGDCDGGSDVGRVVVSVGPATGVDLPQEPQPEPAAAAPAALGFTPRFEESGRTEIALTLPREADVEIDVFDVAGRHVDRIVDGHLAAGRHDLSWESVRQASGVYFARLVARTGTEEMRRTARILLIR